MDPIAWGIKLFAVVCGSWLIYDGIRNLRTREKENGGYGMLIFGVLLIAWAIIFTGSDIYGWTL